MGKADPILRPLSKGATYRPHTPIEENLWTADAQAHSEKAPPGSTSFGSRSSPRKGPRHIKRSGFSVKQRTALSIRITSLFWLPYPTCDRFHPTSLHDFRARHFSGTRRPVSQPDEANVACWPAMLRRSVTLRRSERLRCRKPGRAAAHGPAEDGLAHAAAGCSRDRAGWIGRARVDRRTRHRWTRVRG
jgi:hypothetical protein